MKTIRINIETRKRPLASVMTLIVALLALFASCSNDAGEPLQPNVPADTPVTIGNITVHSSGSEGSEALHPSSRAGEAPSFYAGDELYVSGYSPSQGDFDLGLYRHTPHGTWEGIPNPNSGGNMPIALGDVPDDADIFYADANDNSIITDQSTWTQYHLADWLYGNLDLDRQTGTLGTTEDTGPLNHIRADLVITISAEAALPGSPADDGTTWASASEFEHHIRAARITIYGAEPAQAGSGGTPRQYTPYIEGFTTTGTGSEQTVTATLRLHIPPHYVVDEGQTLITIAPADAPAGVSTLEGTYHLADGQTFNRAEGLAASRNQRLAIAYTAYANQRTLAGGQATIVPWTTFGPAQQIEDPTTGFGKYDMLIRTAADLRRFRDRVNAGETTLIGIQGANITLEAEDQQGEGWKPIGYFSNPFVGTYYGNGYTISGLKINRPTADYQGLFGYTAKGANIKDLHLKDATVTGTGYIGGLVGKNDLGTITACYATSCTVTGTGNYTGGLVGDNSGGTITTCHATNTTVTGTGRYTGGLVGNNGGTITACYATGGSVTGKGYYTGGLVGKNDLGTITACYATSAVEGTSYTGGLVGYNSGTITACYATGTVTGINRTGGLVGYNYDATIRYSHAEPKGTPTKLVGIDDGTTTNCSIVAGQAGATVRTNWDGKAKAKDASEVTITVGGKVYTGRAIWKTGPEPKLCWQ